MGDNDNCCTDIPFIVGDDEELGHGIFSSTEKKKAARGIILYTVFTEKSLTEISADRLDYAPEPKAVKLGDQRAAAMKPKGKKSFYGWAVLRASKASEDDRSVVDSREESNPYHANILLPIPDDACENDREAIRMFHARQLAERSDWRSRPQTI